MNLGVLLLYCKDNPRATTFTRAWAEAAVHSAADYIFAQSGGRVSINFKVFDWHKLEITSAEWGDLGMGVGAAVRPELIKALNDDLDFEHILIGIDVPGATYGTTPKEKFGTPPRSYTLLAAKYFMPFQICHELCHRFGAKDAWGETESGPMRYLDEFDVMGGDSPAGFMVPELEDPSAPGFGRAGPGVSTPSLMATGWLDPQQQGTVLDLTRSASIFMAGGVAVELSALAGAPRPGSTPPPVAIRYGDQIIEYRVPAADGWDRGIPDPGPNAYGWVVVHNDDPRGATLVEKMKGAVGNILVLGTENPVDLFHHGPLRISVLMPKPANNTVRLALERRAAMQPRQTGDAGSVRKESHAGITVWIPGKDITFVPEYSSLGHILTKLAAVSMLHSAQLVATSEEAEALSQRTAQVIAALQDELSELPATPVSPPLVEALEHISELRQTSERSGSADDAREFIELSRERLPDLERALREAVAAEQGEPPA